MKKQIITTATMVLLMTGMILSCKKKDDPAPSNPSTSSTTTGGTTTSGGTTGTSPGSFQWQENGGSVITADSSFWTTGGWGTGVRAYKGGMANFFEINWATQNNTSVGTKTLTVANYGFTFIKNNVTYSISSNQSLNITAGSSTTLSGNFNLPVSGGTITTVSGTFTSINKK
jgi:hypothetical protein